MSITFQSTPKRVETLAKSQRHEYINVSWSSAEFDGGLALLLGTAAVLVFLFQHSVQGWCPPLPVFRRLGVCTRSEIDQEKFALKALRGDFDSLPSESENIIVRADQMLRIVKS